MRTSSFILVTKHAALILDLDQSSCVGSKSGKEIEVVGIPFLCTADTCTLILFCPLLYALYLAISGHFEGVVQGRGSMYHTHLCLGRL